MNRYCTKVVKRWNFEYEYFQYSYDSNSVLKMSYFICRIKYQQRSIKCRVLKYAWLYQYCNAHLPFEYSTRYSFFVGLVSHIAHNNHDHIYRQFPRPWFATDPSNQEGLTAQHVVAQGKPQRHVVGKQQLGLIRYNLSPKTFYGPR